jgi:serine/threonine-protein kinase
VTTAPQSELAASLTGRYTIDRELGHGGMATVYLARDLRHERLVALKVLRPDLGAALGPDRFAREIKLAARLQHPHIVSVFDSGATSTGQLWFTMPYVEGESLRERLRRERELPVGDALRITRELAAALEYAHAHGVVHRDVKPENVLLTRQGDALLADFGIARALTAPADTTGSTAPGLAVGTPQYMSPEQATAERTLDARSDVYSLGAVCYEMLAGEPPFVGSSAQAIVAKMLSTDAPSVRVLRPVVTPAIDATLHRALARVPGDRWATAAEFAQALVVAERTGATARDAVRRIPTGLALLGVGFLVGVGVLFAWRQRESGHTVAAASGPVGVAVLPFDNEGDTANAYFASGITDEIRGKLSALPALRLIASASSNQYRHTTKTQNQVGRELGVRYLLTGHIQWEQGANGAHRVRVSPELVEVRDGAPAETKWQQSYDTTLADVFDVQAAVATQVAARLGVVLSSPAEARLAARPTQNLAAYEAYLRSAALVGVDLPTVRRSLAAAQQAVALDSTFAAAWARVSRCYIEIYANSVPTRADADAARRAADRAIALAPTAAEGYLVRGDYYSNIPIDLAAARADYETALRLAPSSSGATGGLANVDASAGHWASALEHARQGEVLNPRAAAPARRVAGLLLAVHRYPEARAAAERGLTLLPGDLALIQEEVMSWLGDGDMGGARRAIAAVPSTIDRAALIAYLSNSGDLYWALDSADRALALTLPPSAFDDDRGAWGSVHADIYWLAGDTMRARRYADSARVAYDAQLGAAPDDYERHQFYGLTLAYLGQRAAAEREGERGLALALATGDQFLNIPYARHVLARLYVAAGNYPRALDQLDSLTAKPYVVSRAWLRIDPTWAPLKGDPRFARLIAPH